MDRRGRVGRGDAEICSPAKALVVGNRSVQGRSRAKTRGGSARLTKLRDASASYLRGVHHAREKHLALPKSDAVCYLTEMQKQALVIIPLLLVSGAENPRSKPHRPSPPHLSKFDPEAPSRFSKLALACVHKEYPNKLSHTLNSDTDVAPPRKLTPAFYGCYDWHSSVHGHWLLARLARTFPDADFAQPARDALRQSLTKENIATEAAYLRAEGRASFERPYGLAWLLQLGAELKQWSDP